MYSNIGKRFEVYIKVRMPYQNMTHLKQRKGGIEKSEEISVPLVSFYGKNSGIILYLLTP